MEFEEIPPDEVQKGDWFEDIRLGFNKNKIPEIDREEGVIRTVIGMGNKVEYDLEDTEYVTFYRRTDVERPRGEPEEATEESEQEQTEEQEPEEKAPEEKIQEVRDHLDQIEGIGPAKIDNVIEAGYNTIDKLKEADRDKLTDEINGIGESKAKDIKLSLIE